jgi:hypothetical protein
MIYHLYQYHQKNVIHGQVYHQPYEVADALEHKDQKLPF